MTLTIGRFSTADEATVDQSGNSVTFGFHLRPTVASDDDHFHALVQQVLGLVDNEDEEVVPVTWSQDATFDGFYRVTSVSIPNSPIRIRDGIVLNCSVTLERLRGYANPIWEITGNFVVRTNGNGVTNPGGFVALPEDATQRLVKSSSTATLGSGTITTATGTLHRFDLAVASYPSFIATLAAAPSDFFDGAALIEVKYGSSWYTAIGRDIPSTPATGVRLSNGIIRVGWVDDGGDIRIRLEVWNGSAWETSAEDFVPVFDTTSNLEPVGAVNILRNSPEQVIVSVPHQYTSASSPYFLLTFSLARGFFGVELTMGTLSGSSSLTFNLAADTITASTSITGGIRRTSNDASGNRWWMVSALAPTKDLVNGDLTVTGTTPHSFALGMELNGSGAAAGQDAVTTSDQFYAAISQRQRAVTR